MAGYIDLLKGTDLYLRFVVDDVDGDSQKPLGVFQAIHNLRSKGILSDYECVQDDEIGRWFDSNLPKPTRFTSSKPPFHNKKSKAISWFKHTAEKHISQIRSLAAILQNHGVFVHMLKAERVGYVVYEDEFQVVAEPFPGEE
jgi:hypothetical protein